VLERERERERGEGKQTEGEVYLEKDVERVKGKSTGEGAMRPPWRWRKEKNHANSCFHAS
jgi:hypothetical protein